MPGQMALPLGSRDQPGKGLQQEPRGSHGQDVVRTRAEGVYWRTVWQNIKTPNLQMTQDRHTLPSLPRESRARRRPPQGEKCLSSWAGGGQQCCSVAQGVYCVHELDEGPGALLRTARIPGRRRWKVSPGSQGLGPGPESPDLHAAAWVGWGLRWRSHHGVTQGLLLHLPFGPSAPPGLSRVTGLSRGSRAAVKPKTGEGAREGKDGYQASALSRSSLAGPVHKLTLPHPDWAASPLMSTVTWAGCSISCLLAQLSFLSARWPAASARQQEGTGGAEALPAQPTARSSCRRAGSPEEQLCSSLRVQVQTVGSPRPPVQR